MLIYDSFSSREKASAFANAVIENYGRAAAVYDTQEQSNVVDPFPFRLTPPIVLVDSRDEDEDEPAIIGLARRFGGNFAGT